MQDLEGSALALIPAQPSAGHPDTGAELVQEVAALKGLLQKVAPQLDELAGMKQQMTQLMSALRPGKLHVRKLLVGYGHLRGGIAAQRSGIRLGQMTYHSSSLVHDVLMPLCANTINGYLPLFAFDWCCPCHTMSRQAPHVAFVEDV